MLNKNLIRRKIKTVREIAEISVPRKCRKTVRLAYYPGKNFGDMLSPILVSHYLGEPIRYAHYHGADIAAVGSILNPLEQWKNYRKPMVWGSGYIYPGKKWSGFPVDPRAVRGELTRSRLMHTTSRAIKLGDPGILVGEIYPELLNVEKRFKISIIPHLFDLDSVEVQSVATKSSEINVISPRNEPLVVLEQIAASDLVLSSSLHGLICADALGVANIWTPLSNKLEGGSYKFEDYYSAYDLSPTPVKLKDALRDYIGMEPSETIAKKLPALQTGLIEAFPAEDLKNLYGRHA